MTSADISGAVSNSDNPVGHVRGLVGDTSQTLEQIDEHNAAWHAICDKAKQP